ncbi:hypothetical protein HDU76_003784 [Blyttiomyces sp. JEL0837]|nr:hypothetical protein HDU76_003784 [Blyttiomyces sp. JEL0837]
MAVKIMGTSPHWISKHKRVVSVLTPQMVNMECQFLCIYEGLFAVPPNVMLLRQNLSMFIISMFGSLTTKAIIRCTNAILAKRRIDEFTKLHCLILNQAILTRNSNNSLKKVDPVDQEAETINRSLFTVEDEDEILTSKDTIDSGCLSFNAISVDSDAQASTVIPKMSTTTKVSEDLPMYLPGQTSQQQHQHYRHKSNFYQYKKKAKLKSLSSIEDDADSFTTFYSVYSKYKPSQHLEHLTMKSLNQFNTAANINTNTITNENININTDNADTVNTNTNNTTIELPEPSTQKITPYTILEASLKTLNIPYTTPNTLGIDTLSSLFVEWQSRISASLIVLILFGFKSSWAACHGGTNFYWLLIEILSWFIISSIIEIGILKWEIGFVGYNFEEVLDVWNALCFDWTSYWRWSFMAGCTVGCLIAVEAGLFKVNNCFLQGAR